MNYTKLYSLRKILFVFEGCLCLILHYKFIIIPPIYELFFLIIIATIIFLCNRILKSKVGKNIIEKIFICYITTGIILFCWSFYMPPKMYIVRMDGYSRAKIDKIFFKFKGYPFQEYYTLTGYNGLDSPNKYEIRLYLKEPCPYIYYISEIALCKI